MSTWPAVMTLDQIHATMPPGPLHMPKPAEPSVTLTHPIAATDEIRARLEQVEKRDRDANKRARDHLLWILAGLILTGMLPYLPLMPFIAAFLAGCPTACLEIQDWIKHW